MAERKVALQSMFGKPDRKGQEDDGMVQSEYPAWKMDNQIDTLDNEINELGADISANRIPSEDLFDAKDQLHALQERFDQIVISKPNYTPSEETFLHNELERMNQDFSDTLYSRYDQLKGKGSIARPQQEADLNDKPCIKVNPEIAKICNVNNVVNGKISRNQADKIRKILCHYFNRDDASRESIRPENNQSRHRPMVGYTNDAFARAHRRIFGTKDAPNPNNLETPNDEQPTRSKVEDIKRKIVELSRELGEMETNAKEPNAIVTETPEVPKRKTKSDKTYVCPEEGCGFVGKLTQKGPHIQKHKREKLKAEQEK